MALDLLWSDIRLASRNAFRRPGFTLLVALTLALGLGVNSAVFALLDGVLLRPLPYRDPSRLVFVWQTLPSHNVLELEATPFDYDAWHSLRSLSALAMVYPDTYTLTGDDNPERIRGSRVTASLMPMLGIAPRIGRAFTPAEDLDVASPVVILSDDVWRRRFGADERVLGRTLQIDGEPRTIVGVMPPRVALPGPLAESGELWLPARLTAEERINESSHNYRVLGRLTDGTTLEQASAELRALASRMAVERPSHRNTNATMVAVPEQTVRSVRPTLVLIAVSVALLLLVASANASTLLLARASNRQHELAVRTALGATRGRLLSFAVAESVVLTCLGGVAGLILGAWTLRAVLPLFTEVLPRAVPIQIDGRVTLFTVAVSCLLALAFGFIVFLQSLDGALAERLKGTSRTVAGGRARGGLVVAQVALAVVLLSAAGLMVNSVIKLSHVQTGFDADHLLTFKVALAGSRYASAPSRAAFATTLVERLDQTPGVRTAGLSTVIPFSGGRAGDAFAIEGRPRQPGELLIADQRHVSTDYFRTMHIPLVKGRLLEASDGRGEQVVVINRTMAARQFPDEDPIDRRVKTSSSSWLRIVGVVEDVRHVGLTRDPVTEMYRPIAQTAAPVFTVVVRCERDPAALTSAARAVVQTIDPDLPIYDVRTMEERIANSVAQIRGTMLLLLVTAVLAATLSGVAIYGSIWYSVSQRIPEIGVRLALGASRASVFTGVLRRALSLTAAGVTIGVAAAIGAGRLIAGLLFETRATDPTTLIVVACGTMLVAVAAGIVPARRAMSVDPIIALRNE